MSQNLGLAVANLQVNFTSLEAGRCRATHKLLGRIARRFCILDTSTTSRRHHANVLIAYHRTTQALMESNNIAAAAIAAITLLALILALLVGWSSWAAAPYFLALCQPYPRTAAIDDELPKGTGEAASGGTERGR